MIAATKSAATPSARTQPVTRMIAPAAAVAAKATRSVRTCWKAPSTFSESRFAFASSRVAAMFTTTPPRATSRIASPAGSGGSISRRIPS